MSSILNSTMSSMNAIQILIDNISEKILNPHYVDPSNRISIENNVDSSHANTGVRAQQVYDEYNDFVDSEKRKTSEKVQDEETKIEQYLKIENLFIKKIRLFDHLMVNLNASIEENIINHNQNVFNEQIEKNLNDIIYELKDFNDQLTSLEKDVRAIISEKIKKANILINKIYHLNSDITYFPVKQAPNGIYKDIEERDKLIDELNDIIGVQVVKTHDNFEVCLNNGMCIIDNNKKINLIALRSKTDPKYISVGVRSKNEKKFEKIEHMIPSGSLGALFSFSRTELLDARNKLGQLTINFTGSINEHHTLGYDALGNLGRQVFDLGTPTIIPSSKNPSHHETSIKWISTSEAQDTNYVVFFKNGIWLVKRLRDQTVLEPEIYKNNDNTYLEFDGMEFKIEGHEYSENIYMIKPYEKTLDEMKLLIKENTPFAASSTDDISQQNKNNAIIIQNLNKDKLVNKKDTLGKSYLKFLKSISYKCNDLEEKVPFKRNMLRILKDKKILPSDDINKEYKNLSDAQKAYMANVKVLKMAESIFNDIVDCYS